MWREKNFSKELKMAGLLSNPYEELAFDSEEILEVDPVKILDVLARNKILLTCYENISRFPNRYDPFKSLNMLIKKTLDNNRRLMVDLDQKILVLNELLLYFIINCALQLCIAAFKCCNALVNFK